MQHLLRWHIPMFVLAYLMLLASAGAGLLYLIQEHQIKQHCLDQVSARLPSLEAMERFVARMISYSFPLLTIGILLGAHLEFLTRGRFWGWDPVETFSLASWVLYAFYLSLRWGRGLRGRKSIYLAFMGFGLCLLTLLAVFFFSPLHSRGGTI
jgi:ABC-type transport system involved in cytochrome c biogenesis permease subunit